MAYDITNKGETVSEGNSGFAPLPAGAYQVTIIDAEIGEYKNGGNAGRPQLVLQFRIADGQTGANRRLFSRIGLFSKWAPTDKNPDGADNFTFFNFLAALLGKSEKDVRDEYRAAAAGKGKFSIPDPEELLGSPLTVNLKIVKDGYSYQKAVDNGTLEEGQTIEDFKTNDIASFKPAGEVTSGGASSKDEGLVDL